MNTLLALNVVIAMMFIRQICATHFFQIYINETIVYPLFYPYICLFADEKTEDPTPKKLQDAKKKGQVAKSPDLNSVIVLLAAAMLIGISGDFIYNNLLNFLRNYLDMDANILFTKGTLFHLVIELILQFFKITLPIFIVIMMVGIAANVLQTGFIYSNEPLKPNLKKLNPIEGFKRIFSKKAIFDFMKNFFKLVIVALATYFFMKGNLKQIFSIALMRINGLFPFFKEMVKSLMFRIAFVLGILAVIDFMYQKYDYKKNLKMTKQEIKDEFKQMEGDPLIKSQRKQKQRQLAMSRMMAEVPEATVIVTNPTHLAVALKYEQNAEEAAPIVIAKGADFIAQKIKEIGNEKDIPIIENKPLARVLYKKVEIGEEIPIELYQAVAEILAMVYQMKRKNNYF